MQLDYSTVMASMIMMHALCAYVMAELWYDNHTESPMIALWFIDFAAQPLALGLMLGRGHIPDFVSIIVPNLLLVGGLMLLHIGVERFVGIYRSNVVNLVALVAFLAVQMHLTYGFPNGSLRTAMLGLGLAFYAAQTAWTLLFGVEPRIRPATTMTGVAFLLIVVANGVRSLTHLATFAPGGAFRPSFTDSAALLVQQMFVVLITFSLVLMVSRRLRIELEADVSERRIAEERFRTAFRNVPDPMVITDLKSQVIEEINDRFEFTTGFSREEAVGRTTEELGIWIDSEARRHYYEIVTMAESMTAMPARLRRKDGSEFDAEVSGEVMSAAGQLTILSILHDITDRRLAEERLVELSTRDPLTGLLNVRAFHDRAIARMAHAEGSCSVLFIDLDNLKTINDEHGHAVGDEALVRVARVLNETFRESDVVSRIGGDEFAVLCVTREPSEEAIVERLNSAIAAVNAEYSSSPQISVSVGISHCDQMGGQAALNEAIREADQSMYRMKRERRG